jgi:GT2 family glycosyltransferase
LKNCLLSIEASISRAEYEIICVDHGSSDNTVSFLRSHYPQIRLIINKQNPGFAAANNDGLKCARGRYVLFLNPDTVIRGKALEDAMEFLDRNESVAAVGAKLLNPDGSIQPSCESFPSLWGYFLESSFLYLLFGKSKLQGRFLPFRFGYDQALDVDVVKGAFLMARNTVLKQVGGFDPRFFMYVEEVDLCYRMKSLGWRICCLPECEVVHYGGQSSKPMRNRMFVELHKSKIRFHAKHFGVPRALVSAALLFSGVGVRFVLWLALAATAALSKRDRREEILAKFGNYVAACRWYLCGGFRSVLT